MTAGTALLWLVEGRADVPEELSWLAGPEREVLSRLRVPKRRSDWLLGRYTAKRALVLAGAARELSSVEVRAGPTGAPELLVSGEPVPWALSISHSEGMGLAILSPDALSVGADLEQVAPRSPAFLGDYLTDEELALVAEAPPEERAFVATLVWSAKESLLKLLKEGLRLPAKSVAVSLPAGTGSASAGEGSPWRPFVVRGPGARLEPFRGRFCRAGALVATVLADPESGEPRPLGDGFLV